MAQVCGLLCKPISPASASPFPWIHICPPCASLSLWEQISLGASTSEEVQAVEGGSAPPVITPAPPSKKAWPTQRNFWIYVFCRLTQCRLPVGAWKSMFKMRLGRLREGEEQGTVTQWGEASHQAVSPGKWLFSWVWEGWLQVGQAEFCME